MEVCAGKRSVNRLVVPRKASGLILRESVNKKDDKNVPLCSRIGCTANVISTKGTRIGSTVNKTKVGRPPASSNKNEIVGSSSRATGGSGHFRKPAKGTASRQPSSNLDTDSSGSSSIHDDPAAVEPTLPRQMTKRVTINVHSQSTVSGEVVLTNARSSGRGASRSSHQKSGLGTRDALTGSSASSSSESSEHTATGRVSRKRLRNSRCHSVSGFISNDAISATKISASKKISSDGENSFSSKGSKTNVLVPKGRNQITSHGSGITASDIRRNRMVPTIRDNSVVSSSGRKSGYVGRSGRLGAVSSSATSLQTPHPATRTNPNPSLSFSPSNSYSRPNSSTGRLRSNSMMPGNPSEADPALYLANRDGLSRYNMNGIAEVLLALERLEHNEELMYEQIASLETNLFSGGMFRFYDQHRDMRLDIDNMSYEELLALGDKMGTVSTALSEDALSRSLKKRIYQETDETDAVALNKDDDIKCSICQEEYVDGDVVGTMPCQHMYHVSCVQQWLRMKNWCPICKTSAEEESRFSDNDNTKSISSVE